MYDLTHRVLLCTGQIDSIKTSGARIAAPTLRILLWLVRHEVDVGGSTQFYHYWQAAKEKQNIYITTKYLNNIDKHEK